MNAAQLGGGSSDYSFSRVVQTSETFTAQKTGWHRFTGAGGSGSAAGCSAAGGVATGASTGALGQVRVWMTAGQTAVITIGAGGTAPTPVTGGVVQGNDGNDTTVVVGGITYTAGRGKGGKASSSTTQTGPGGGVATNWDINLPGGDAGTCVFTAGGKAASGGGALPVQGIPYSSGTAQAASGFGAASGGAGIGGKSGNALAVSAETRTAGGGVGGPSPDATSASSTVGGADALGTQSSNTKGTLAPNYYRIGFFGFATASGSSLVNTASDDGGGGSCGTTGNIAGAGGAFAGGGAYAIQSGGGQGGAAGRLGGAPGGNCCEAAATATPKAGGNGWVFIEA